MTTDAFIQAIQGMRAIPPAMATRLIRLAPAISPKEREQTIQELTPIHADMQADQREVEANLEAAEQELRDAEKELLPKIREAEQRRDAAKADDILDRPPSA